MTKNNKPAHVIMNHEVFFYKNKAPFVSSGKSIAGALEYDKDNDLVKCHECGEFYKMLGRHVHDKHEMTARAYKIKHELNQSTALLAEKVRHKISDKAQKRVEREGSPHFNTEKRIKALKASRRPKTLASAERRNGVMHCKAQLMEKLRNAAIALKRTPSCSEMKEFGIPQGSLEHHYGCLANAMKLAGLVPNGNIGQKNKHKYSEEYLLRSIRLFKANNARMPSATDFNRGLLGASRSGYLYRFGSIKKAIKKAFAQ
jgi:hypothetical protein